MSEKILYRYIVFIILTAFFLGAYLLENMGVQYTSEGGSPLVKIHIYAYVTLLLFFYLCLRYGLLRVGSATEEYKGCWYFSLIALSLVITYGLYRFGTSGTAYLVNTILVPIFIFPMMCMLSKGSKAKLLRLLAWLLLINSLVALFEFSMQRSLVSVEFSSFSHFRSTAFLTHPLNNALITASLAPVLMSASRVPPVIYFSIVLLSLFAFGGRAAMAIYLLGTLAVSFHRIKGFMTSGIRVNRIWAGILPLVFIFAVSFIAYALLFTPIAERIFSKLFIDRSAEARFDVFILLEELSLKEWIYGAAPSLLENIKFFIGIKVIENYVVSWVVYFGLPFSILLIVSAYRLPFKSMIKGSAKLRVCILIFLLVSLSNNALNTKTPALLFLFLIVVCCKQDDTIQNR